MSGLSLFGSGLTITEAQGPTYYLGTWNASTNTPTLASSTAPAGPGGSYYIVSVAGTTDLNGITDWTVGDWVIWSGSVWQKLEGGMTSVTVGSTQIAGGTSGRVLYDNAGVLGEMTNTGTGTVNVLQTSPALITPALGIATGTSLALGGASLGGNVLAVTGSIDVSSHINSSGNIIAGAALAFNWFGRSVMASPSDGVITIRNNAGTDFSRLQFGGTTSSFPAIKRVSTRLQVRLADDSANANIQAFGFVMNSGSFIGDSSDGVFRLSNSAGTDFSRLQFGGGTSSFPSIKRNATALNFRLADDSADAPITAAAGTFSGVLTVPGVTTAALTSTGTFTSGAGAQAGTLTNAPAAGNPTTWIKIIDGGVTRYIPAW